MNVLIKIAAHGYNDGSTIILIKGPCPTTRQPKEFDVDAKTLYAALRDSLPSGTMDRLFRHMLKDFSTTNAAAREAADTLLAKVTPSIGAHRAH